MKHAEADPEPRLHPAGAFLVQVRSDAEIEAGRLCGRVEHVMSGDSAPFTSMAALLAFMAQHTNDRR